MRTALTSPLLRTNLFPMVRTGITQIRFFDWDPKVTKRDGKPAFTGTKYAYVAAKIPVVMLRDVPGVGVKGEIVDVKRGFARNVLVPKGDAVYGTVWQNIDEFADPELVNKKKVAQAGSAIHRASPFEWLNSVKLEFLREVEAPGSSNLSEPVTVAELLMAMSEQEQVDLLPSQISVYDDVIRTVGKHSIEVSLSLLPGNFKYRFVVDVKDKAEVAAAERREAELKEAMKMKRPEFVLGAGKIGKPSAAGDLDDLDNQSNGSDSDSDSD